MAGWRKINSADYTALFHGKLSVFHSAGFNALNEGKAETVHYLLNSKASGNYGIILGKFDDVLRSPFSSPFGGIDYDRSYTANEIMQVCEELRQYADQHKLSVQLTLPPVFYNPEFIDCCTSSLISSGFKVIYKDINYHLDIVPDRANIDLLARNAKKNLKKALRLEHKLIKASSPEEIEGSYDIIRQNRTQRGFPLKLTLDDLLHTGKVVPIDFFSLRIEGSDCAAAIVYHLRPDIAMVVYWGHLYAYSDYRPVNLLAHELYNYYQGAGIHFLDIGPSSEKGVLNEGLASFKESLGCVTTDKNTLLYTYG